MTPMVSPSATQHLADKHRLHDSTITLPTHHNTTSPEPSATHPPAALAPTTPQPTEQVQEMATTGPPRDELVATPVSMPAAKLGTVPPVEDHDAGLAGEVVAPGQGTPSASLAQSAASAGGAAVPEAEVAPTPAPAAMGFAGEEAQAGAAAATATPTPLPPPTPSTEATAAAEAAAEAQPAAVTPTTTTRDSSAVLAPLPAVVAPPPHASDDATPSSSSSSPPPSYERVPLEKFQTSFASASTEVSSVALGGKVVGVSDEWFAPASDLLKVAPAVSMKGQFGPEGAKFDGWESRRHNPRHDWTVIRLGARYGAELVGFDVDTSHFSGNEAPEAAVYGLRAEGEGGGGGVEAVVGREERDDAVDEADPRWKLLLPRVALGPSSRHLFKVPRTPTVTHLKLLMIPDGGIARFRAYGVVPPPPLGYGEGEGVTDASRPELNVLDLAHVMNGGRVVFTSDQHFGVGSNLLLPGRGKDMGDGWETKRSRTPGHRDWVVIKLGEAGILSYAEVDTLHFLGNFPESFQLHAIDFKGEMPVGTDTAEDPSVFGWTEILPRSKLSAGRQHYFGLPAAEGRRFTHVRLTMFPDGGIKRLRLFGRRAAPLANVTGPIPKVEVPTAPPTDAPPSSNKAAPAKPAASPQTPSAAARRDKALPLATPPSAHHLAPSETGTVGGSSQTTTSDDALLPPPPPPSSDHKTKRRVSTVGPFGRVLPAEPVTAPTSAPTSVLSASRTAARSMPEGLSPSTTAEGAKQPRPVSMLKALPQAPAAVAAAAAAGVSALRGAMGGAPTEASATAADAAAKAEGVDPSVRRSSQDTQGYTISEAGDAAGSVASVWRGERPSSTANATTVAPAEGGPTRAAAVATSRQPPPSKTVLPRQQRIVEAMPLTPAAFSAFGSVLGHPAATHAALASASTDVASSSTTTVGAAGPDALGESVNQGSARKFRQLGVLEHDFPWGCDEYVNHHLYRCTSEPLPLPIRVLERHRHSSQSFVPLGRAVGVTSPTTATAGDKKSSQPPTSPPPSPRYLVVVALNDAQTDSPDLSTLSAFVADATCQGIVYGKGVWHLPMRTVAAATDAGSSGGGAATTTTATTTTTDTVVDFIVTVVESESRLELNCEERWYEEDAPAAIVTL